MTDIFLHIPKTGGTTLASALRWMVYGPGAAYRFAERPYSVPAPKEKQEDTARRLVTGHVPFGVHRSIRGPCRYFTMLRHPVRRVVSHYYYHRTRKPESTLAARPLEYFHESEHPVARRNQQVHFLSSTSPENHPRAALHTAMTRLQRRVTAFGITERFDASLVVLRDRLDWPIMPFYLNRKQNVDRPTVEELPSSTVATLREQNALDLELYRFARNCFETELEENHPDLASTLRSFRRWNRVVQSLMLPLLPLYRSARAAFTSRQ